MSKVDRFEVDKLTSMDADYPHDDAVPELPPVPDAVNPPPPPDNFNWTCFQDDVHPQARPFPTPLTDIVTEEKSVESGCLLVDAQPLQLPVDAAPDLAELELQRRCDDPSYLSGSSTHASLQW